MDLAQVAKEIGGSIGTGILILLILGMLSSEMADMLICPSFRYRPRSAPRRRRPRAPQVPPIPSRLEVACARISAWIEAHVIGRKPEPAHDEIPDTPSGEESTDQDAPESGDGGHPLPPGTCEEAEKGDFKRLYRRLVKEWHPDLCLCQDPRAKRMRQEIMIRINGLHDDGDSAGLHQLARSLESEWAPRKYRPVRAPEAGSSTGPGSRKSR